MSVSDRQSQAFFEAQYQASHDPWHFASSPYELDRYKATLDALSHATYRCAYEPGCSVGVLTVALAQRCERVIACDIAHGAVLNAQARCRHLGHVDISQRDAADGPPSGSFDLMVFSEIGYYFSAARLTAICRRMADQLDSGGEFVAVHWLGRSADHVLHGDAVHELLAETLALEPLSGSRHAGFRIDSWRKTP
jgi:SAM-dependent methyltransferase